MWNAALADRGNCQASRLAGIAPISFCAVGSLKIIRPWLGLNEGSNYAPLFFIYFLSWSYIMTKWIYALHCLLKGTPLQCLLNLEADSSGQIHEQRGLRGRWGSYKFCECRLWLLVPADYLFPLLFFQAGHHSWGTLVYTLGFSIRRFSCCSELAMAWSLNPFPVWTLHDQAWLHSAVPLNSTWGASPWFLYLAAVVASTALCYTQRPCWFFDRLHTSYSSVQYQMDQQPCCSVHRNIRMTILSV